MSDTPTATVARVTIARLFNLGNYEHVRYEITAEVPAGADAGQAARRLKSILWNLRPVKTDKWALSCARKLIEDPVEHGQHYTAEQIPGAIEDAKKFIAAHEASHARIDRALSALADLGGTVEEKDAKESWEGDEYD